MTVVITRLSNFNLFTSPLAAQKPVRMPIHTLKAVQTISEANDYKKSLSKCDFFFIHSLHESLISGGSLEAK